MDVGCSFLLDRHRPVLKTKSVLVHRWTAFDHPYYMEAVVWPCSRLIFRRCSLAPLKLSRAVRVPASYRCPLQPKTPFRLRFSVASPDAVSLPSSRFSTGWQLYLRQFAVVCATLQYFRASLATKRAHSFKKPPNPRPKVFPSPAAPAMLRS